MAGPSKTVRNLGARALLGGKAGIVTAGIEAARPLATLLIDALSDPQARQQRSEQSRPAKRPGSRWRHGIAKEAL